MKLLMLMRDSLPPTRVDVSVLFDRVLRGLGLETDFAGERDPAGGKDTAACRGLQFDTGSRRGLASAFRQARLAWRLADHYGVMVVRDLPFAGLGIAAACALRRRPFVYWMSFPMPLGDRLGARQHWRQGRRLRAALAWLRGTLAQPVQDRLVLPRAAHVFVQSDAMRTQLLRDVPALAAARVTAVPMGIDAPQLPSCAEASDSSDDAPEVIAYLGSLDAARRLEVLIDTLALVRRTRPRASLWLIGAAPRAGDLEALQRRAEHAGVADHLSFRGALPMALAWGLLQQAQVAVSAVPPGPLHDVSSPTKLVEYLALGLPVVANDIPDQRALLEACGGGRCVAFDAQAFADAIVDLLADQPAARAAAADARARLLALRSYDVLGANVARVLRRCAA